RLHQEYGGDLRKERHHGRRSPENSERNSGRDYRVYGLPETKQAGIRLGQSSTHTFQHAKAATSPAAGRRSLVALYCQLRFNRFAAVFTVVIRLPPSRAREVDTLS